MKNYIEETKSMMYNMFGKVVVFDIKNGEIRYEVHIHYTHIRHHV